MSTQPHDAFSIPIEAIDVSDPQLYQDDTWQPLLERLRREVQCIGACESFAFGPYWSVTQIRGNFCGRAQPRVATRRTRSSAVFAVGTGRRGASARLYPDGTRPGMTAAPSSVAPIVAPSNLANLEQTIREDGLSVC